MKIPYLITGNIFISHFKCGDVFGIGTATSGIAQMSGNLIATNMTNKSNERIARERNEFEASQADIERAYNSEEAQKQRDFNSLEALKARDFESVEAEKARDFNSIDSQIQRGLQAGVTPSAIIGAGAGATPVTGFASGTAASSSASPSSPHVSPALAHLIPPQFDLSGVGQMADASLKLAQASKVKEETQSISTYNQFQKDLLSLDKDVKQWEIANMYADYCNTIEYANQIKATVANIQKNTALQDAQLTKQDMDNMWNTMLNAAEVYAKNSQGKVSEETAKAIFMKTPLECNLLSNQALASYWQGMLSKANISYTDAMTNNLGIMGNILKTEDSKSSFMLGLIKKWEPVNWQNDASIKGSTAKTLKFQSSDTYQYFQCANQGLNTLSNVLSSTAKFVP